MEWTFGTAATCLGDGLDSVDSLDWTVMDAYSWLGTFWTTIMTVSYLPPTQQWLLDSIVIDVQWVPKFLSKLNPLGTGRLRGRQCSRRADCRRVSDISSALNTNLLSYWPIALQYNRSHRTRRTCIRVMEGRGESRSDMAAGLSLQGPSTLSHHDLRPQLEAIRSWDWHDNGLRPRIDGRDQENKGRKGCKCRFKFVTYKLPHGLTVLIWLASPDSAHSSLWRTVLVVLY